MPSNDRARDRATHLVPASLAAWLIFLAVDFLGHAVILAGYWRDTAAYWRPPEELFRMIPVSYAAFAIYCAGLAWLLQRIYGVRLSTVAGLRFGGAAGLLYWGSFSLCMISVFRMPVSAVVLWTVWGAAESSLAGGMAAHVLSASKAWRQAGWACLIALSVFVASVILQNLFGLGTASR